MAVGGAERSAKPVSGCRAAIPLSCPVLHLLGASKEEEVDQIGTRRKLNSLPIERDRRHSAQLQHKLPPIESFNVVNVIIVPINLCLLWVAVDLCVCVIVRESPEITANNHPPSSDPSDVSPGLWLCGKSCQTIRILQPGSLAATVVATDGTRSNSIMGTVCNNNYRHSEQ